MSYDNNETKEKILEVSFKLFKEKGFEETTIQDILNELDGMTQGAIYYYFESKKDILENITEEYFVDRNIVTKGDNFLDKFRNRILYAMDFENAFSKIKMTPIYLKTPKMLGENYRWFYNKKIEYARMLEEGIKEKAIKTDFPEEVAEFILIYVHLCMNMHILQFTKEEYLRKVEFVKETLEVLGVPIINGEIMNKAEELYDKTLPYRD